MMTNRAFITSIRPEKSNNRLAAKTFSTNYKNPLAHPTNKHYNIRCNIIVFARGALAEMDILYLTLIT